jgi:hypothetical protein
LLQSEKYDRWLKVELHCGLQGADVEFVDPSANGGEYGIFAVHLLTPSGVAGLD